MEVVMKTTYAVDIVPQLDITGNFKKLKDINVPLSEKVIYNQLVTIISMRRGFNPWMPDMGVADIIASIPFNTEYGASEIIEQLEGEVGRQTDSECKVTHTFGTESDGTRFVTLYFTVSTLPYSVPVRYRENDPNITVVSKNNIKELYGVDK